MRIILLNFLFLLISFPHGLRSQGTSLDERLLDAVLNRDLKEIKILIFQGADPNVRKFFREYDLVNLPQSACHAKNCIHVLKTPSAIEAAIDTDQFPVLELFLKSGTSDSYLLRSAQSLGRTEMFRFMTQHGVRGNGHELEYSAHHCEIEFLKILLEEGIRDNGRAEPDTLGSPLAGAASGNCTAALELLISFGFNIDEPLPEWEHTDQRPIVKMTPILTAIEKASIDSYFFLREKNAKLKATDGIRLIQSVFESHYPLLLDKKRKLHEEERRYQKILMDLMKLKKIQESLK